ncbi:MAG: NAD(P)/FAD-dependent oxidoreductase [Gemmatimonadales bacterium]
MKPRRARVVIVGGGFGGIYAAAYLSRSELADRGLEITLIDRKNYFTFTPLLAEVAAGALGREHLTYPYRVLARRYKTRFVQDAAEGLDLDRCFVKTRHTEIPYDYLILATGAEPQYFGNETIKQRSLPLTSVNCALAVRGQVMGSLERAVYTENEAERRRLLTFVVAGAGPAGVEIASAIHNLAGEVLDPYYGIRAPAKVILAGADDRILAAFDKDLAREGLARLRQRGVEVRLNTRITDIAAGVITAQGPGGYEQIQARTLVWTAGMAPAQWLSQQELSTERGSLKIDPFLRVEGCENVFAIGDATMLRDERSGQPYPRVAPIAISQGVRAAANIENNVLGRSLEPYQAHHAGKIVSLGGGVALVDILGIQVRGIVAWWIYRLAYLLKLVGTKNKIRVLVTLILNRIFEPDLSYE